MGSGAVRVAAMLASFTVGVQLARGLGLESYGYYSVALSVITIASIPGEFGLPFLVTREVAAAAVLHDNARLFGVIRWATRTCIVSAGAVALAVFAGGSVLSHFGLPSVGAALQYGAPAILLIALAKVHSSSLQGLSHIVRGQIPQNLLRPIILSVLLALFWLTGVRLSAAAAMAFNSAAAAGVLVVAYIWSRQRLPTRIPPKDVHSGSRWLASTVPLGLMDGMRILQPELAILLLSITTTPALVGLLRIANVTAQIAAAAIAVVVHVTLPIMAQLHARDDQERLQKTVTAVAQVQFAGVLILTLPLLLFPGPLLGLAFGVSFAPAAPALRILCVSQIANAAFGPNVWVLNMTHHEKQVARAMAIAVAITVISVPLLAYRAGITGAAVGLMISMLCWNVIAWRDARKLLAIETSILHWPWR